MAILMPLSNTRLKLHPTLALALVVASALCLRSPAETLRIATFNLYNRPWERPARLSSAAKTFEPLQLDILALQEVATGLLLPGNPLDQLNETLMKGKGYTANEWHETNFGVFKTGVGILSRYRIRSSRYIEFEKSAHWDPKGFLHAEVETEERTFNVITVHLASTDDREIFQAEIKQLQTYVSALKGPSVVAGDFNLEYGDKLLEEFKEKIHAVGVFDSLPEEKISGTWTESYRSPCNKFPSDPEPTGKPIDHIFLVKGSDPDIALHSGEIIVPSAKPHPSDHCPVIAEIKIGGARLTRRTGK